MNSRSLRIAFPLLALAALLGACSAPSADTNKDQSAIRAVFESYSSTLEDYDADGWMSLWDENGVQLPPDAPMRVGKASVKEANYDGIKDTSGVFKMSVTVQEVLVFPAEGYGIARGVYHWTWIAKDGKSADEYDGKFMTLLHKQKDGSWRIFRDIFNSNGAAAK